MTEPERIEPDPEDFEAVFREYGEARNDSEHAEHYRLAQMYKLIRLSDAEARKEPWISLAARAVAEAGGDTKIAKGLLSEWAEKDPDLAARLVRRGCEVMMLEHLTARAKKAVEQNH